MSSADLNRSYAAPKTPRVALASERPSAPRVNGTFAGLVAVEVVRFTAVFETAEVLSLAHHT